MSGKRIVWAVCGLSSLILLALGIVGYIHFPQVTAIFSGQDAHDESLLRQTSCTFPEEKCNIRLSSEVTPIHYDVYLYPKFNEGSFTGNVKIQLEIKSNVDHIRLHVKQLEVRKTGLKALLGKGNEKELPVQGYENLELEYWVVKPQNSEASFSPGLYNLYLEFEGNLTRGLVGLYRSSYFDKKANATKYVVSTKFQSTYARRAFPCFDEPSIKSTFTVTLVKPSDLVAISNMPIRREEVNQPEAGLTTVSFQKSVPMVTYLVALAIGDFAYVERISKRGIPVRVYTTSFQIEHGQYANNITADILDFYEEYFGITYPLPKLDIVGIPDFISGAMENWGMVSFRESTLFFQPGVGSESNKKSVTSVIAHELAHMWFGNYMTLKWWNDLWLNEGFASYMEYKGMNAVKPDWEIEKQFVVDDLSLVLGLDGLVSSHPIVQEVHNPSQITELFDKISYAKGASVIRMLENFMGREKFRNGVTAFLKKFAYANAETSDLWDNLQDQVDKDGYNISFVMDTWTRQMGYPVVSLVQNLISKGWELKQERFFENQELKSIQTDEVENPFKYKWEIPLMFETFGVEKTEPQLLWMKHNAERVKLPISEQAFRWAKLNVGVFGYYRVKYPDSMYATLKQDLLQHFSAPERCGTLDDALSLAFADYIGYNVSLAFSQVLKDESHFIPWGCTWGHFTTIGRLLKGSNPEAYSLYQKYIVDLVSKLYDSLSWTDSEDDHHLERLLKPVIFSLACQHGHARCLQATKSLFQSWLRQPSSKHAQIPAGLREIVYQWGMYQSDRDHWDKVLQIYSQESDPQERVRLLHSLAYTQDEATLKEFLQISKNETLVKRQDYFTMIKFCSRNPKGTQIVWDFYRNEYKYLVDRFTLNDRYFGRAIYSVTFNFSTKERLQEVEEHLQKNPEGGAGTRSRMSALENVRNNVAWTEKNVEEILVWLRRNYV